jgi:hypothetical protein
MEKPLTITSKHAPPPFLNEIAAYSAVYAVLGKTFRQHNNNFRQLENSILCFNEVASALRASVGKHGLNGKILTGFFPNFAH